MELDASLGSGDMALWLEGGGCAGPSPAFLPSSEPPLPRWHDLQACLRPQYKTTLALWPGSLSGRAELPGGGAGAGHLCDPTAQWSQMSGSGAHEVWLGLLGGQEPRL